MNLKKTVSLAVASLVLAASMTGCANSRDITTMEGNTSVTYEYQPYGIFDEGTMKNDKIAYDVSWGNVILGIIFVETIIAPIAIFGWYLYEPQTAKVTNAPKGVK